MADEGARGRAESEMRARHLAFVDRPLDELTPAELDEWAAALFWLNDPWRSVEVRQAAYRGWADRGDDGAAARSAWFIFYEHWLVGEGAVATGWLGRARRHLREGAVDPGSPVVGWVALAEADVAEAEGRIDEAIEAAGQARTVGRKSGDADLVAMALQAEGRYLVAAGAIERGLACLDEAMVAVIGGELVALYTGWIYCNVLATCHSIGDVRRANEWSTAALRWCADLRDGLLYPGLCRVYSAQLAQLRGEWSTAEEHARRACDDLVVFDQRYAGAAFGVVGDLCRLQGRTDEARSSYRRAHELGHDPQPGVALLRASDGRVEEAVHGLRSALDSAGAPIPQLQTLLVLAELSAGIGDVDTAVAARDRAEAVADEVGTDATSAFCSAVAGHAALAEGNAHTAVEHLRRAVAALVDLDLPYEVARQRLALARAADAAGDGLTAEWERNTAEAALRRLGVTEADGGNDSRSAANDLTDHGLSARELEVLALVAEGLTNRGVADHLHLSPHTVARHLANIFTKLGVSTRTAAVSTAVAQGILPPTGQD